MARYLVVRVHLHDRFHGMAFGQPEWPPAPARVFQALIAGAARGRSIDQENASAFRWLEGLSPPLVGAPRSSRGEACTLYVPNNDLDSEGGDPGRVGNLRTGKRAIPRLLEGEEPLLYIWELDSGGAEHAPVIIRCAERLSHLGRGVDAAWAQAELVCADALEDELASYPGRLFRPAGSGAAEPGSLQCPVPGSFDSTERRVQSTRLLTVTEGKKRKQHFQSPPRPIFAPVRYLSTADYTCFELVDGEGRPGLSNLPLRRVVRAVESIRDAAVEKLKEALPDPATAQEVDRLFFGRLPDGSQDRSGSPRIRLIPLPSIGHEHADLQLRRVAVHLPASSQVSSRDLLWAFDGLAPVDPETGEVASCVLSSTRESTSMLDRYTERAKRFVSVTPVVLPEVAARRRIDPARRLAEAKGAQERCEEEERARQAVLQALRHAGVRARVHSLRVQREPFTPRGLKADSFAEGTRFAKERLWHLELEFASEVEGPLVIGDGRFVGLGLMQPLVRDSAGFGCWAFSLDAAAPAMPAEALARSFRRAVLARIAASQGEAGRRTLETFFTGHDASGAPAKGSGHLAFHWDPHTRWLLIVAPHRAAQKEATYSEQRMLARLDRALDGFHALRLAGGQDFAVQAVPYSALRSYCGPRRRFASIQPYTVNRHLELGSAGRAIEVDVLAECERLGVPRPRIQVMKVRSSSAGLQGWLKLEFDRAVMAPLALGRTRFLGGGLFLPVEEDALASPKG